MTVATETKTGLAFIANTAPLREAVLACASIVKARSPHEALKCLELSATTDALSVRSTTLELHLQMDAGPVQIEQSGSILVNAEALAGFLQTVNNDTIRMSADASTFEMRTDCGKFNLYPLAADLARAGEIEDATSITVSAESLWRLIEHTKFAMADDNSRYAWHGIHIVASKKDKSLIFEATDGHILSADHEAVAVDANASAIIPADTVGLLSRMLSGVGGEVEIKIGTNLTEFSGDGFVIRTATVEGAFPPVQDVIPKESDTELTTGRDEFLQAIQQVALFKEEVKPGLVFDLAPKRGAIISARSPERGNGEVNYPCKVTGPAVRIAFNPKFLIAMLRASDATEVTLKLTSPNRPGLLELGGNFIGIAMPVNLLR